MMKASFFTLALLFFSLPLLNCQTPGTSKPKVTATDSSYQLEVNNRPSISPCVGCVDFSATTSYKSGNITWNACLSNQPKGYLDLKLSRRARTFHLRLVRDCNYPNVIKRLDCPTNNSADFQVFVTIPTPPTGNEEVLSGSSHVIINEKGASDSVLKVKISNTNQVEITLKAGWLLQYDKQQCTVGGN
ncbi:MAG: hypothetical protein IPJ74_20340 [Saprospiraceae bacterium]|nr:hypothetical protein [Saprospiraceae bacterium]